MKRVNQQFVRGLCLTGAVAGLMMITGCDKEVSSQKSTTVKKTETPEGTKTTTEKTEKKVETDPK
jgi:hypothetical protein